MSIGGIVTPTRLDMNKRLEALKKWQKKNGASDQWYIAINGVVDNNLKTLADIEVFVKHGETAISALHADQAGDTDPQWIELVNQQQAVFSKIYKQSKQKTLWPTFQKWHVKARARGERIDDFLLTFCARFWKSSPVQHFMGYLVVVLFGVGLAGYHSLKEEAKEAEIWFGEKMSDKIISVKATEIFFPIYKRQYEVTYESPNGVIRTRIMDTDPTR
jgi:hypothetical protein